MRFLLSFVLLFALSTMDGHAQATEPCGAFYSIPYTDAFEPITLTLPNTSPFNYVGGPRLVITKLKNSPGVVRWIGMACDEVRIPAGSEIEVKSGPDGEYQHLEKYVWTIRPDGFLDYREK